MAAVWMDKVVWVNRSGGVPARVQTIFKAHSPLSGEFDQLVAVLNATGSVLAGWWAHDATQEELDERAAVLFDLCLVKYGGAINEQKS